MAVGRRGAGVVAGGAGWHPLIRADWLASEEGQWLRIGLARLLHAHVDSPDVADFAWAVWKLAGWWRQSAPARTRQAVVKCQRGGPTYVYPFGEELVVASETWPAE